MTKGMFVGALVAASLALPVARAAAQQAPDPAADGIVGTWFTEDSSSKISIVNNGGMYVGSVSWVKPSADGKSPVDARNSDASLRTRPILGIDILTGFVYAGNNQWKQGKVYAPKKGNSYNGELTLEKDGTLSVKVKAGIGGKTQTWRRA